MMKVEGLPEGTTAEQYISRSAKELLVDSVEWQARAMASGFRQAVDVALLRSWGMDAEALALVLNDGGGSAGTSADIDVRKAFRVVMDQELSGNGAMLGEATGITI